VREAALATIASGTVRFRKHSVDERRAPEMSEWVTPREGVGDFASFRTRFPFETPPPLLRWAARHPRLTGCAPDEAEEVVETLHAGTAVYWGRGGRWSVGVPGDPAAPFRLHGDPLWIVDALRRADEALPRGGARWGFKIDVGRHADLWVGAGRPGRRDWIAGDVWIDDEGRLTWVAWRSGPFRRRADTSRVWSTLALWDHGVPERIPLPATPTEVPAPGRRRLPFRR